MLLFLAQSNIFLQMDISLININASYKCVTSTQISELPLCLCFLKIASWRQSLCQRDIFGGGGEFCPSSLLNPLLSHSSTSLNDNITHLFKSKVGIRLWFPFSTHLSHIMNKSYMVCNKINPKFEQSCFVRHISIFTLMITGPFLSLLWFLLQRQVSASLLYFRVYL